MAEWRDRDIRGGDGEAVSRDSSVQGKGIFKTGRNAEEMQKGR